MCYTELLFIFRRSNEKCLVKSLPLWHQNWQNGNIYIIYLSDDYQENKFNIRRKILENLKTQNGVIQNMPKLKTENFVYCECSFCDKKLAKNMGDEIRLLFEGCRYFMKTLGHA